MEADYSNYLARPLVASCREIYPLPEHFVTRLSLSTRDAVLGHLETGNPKDVIQQDSTQQPQTCLIGICKDMMSSMDPMRTLGMQKEAEETSLATRKFTSSIFCWEELHKSQEGESKNTKQRPWLLHFGASTKGLSPTFYSHKGAY